MSTVDSRDAAAFQHEEAPQGESGREEEGKEIDPDHQQPLASRRNDDCCRYATTFQAMKQHKDHPLRMKVLWDELSIALEIKKAIEETAELDNVSDFMCVHLALICDDTENALHRVQGLQDFRRNYGIVDESHQNGCRALRKLVQTFPNLLLSFDKNPLDGNYILAFDFAGIDATSLTPRDINDFFIGWYYLHLALHPDSYSIQKGPLILVECKDMGWPRMQDLKLIEKLAFEFGSICPFTGTTKHYNTGAVFNVFANAVKKLFPQETAKKMEFGLRCENGLRSIFFVPDATSARQRILHNLEEALRLHFDNKEMFSLAKSNQNSIVPLDDDEIEAVSEARSIVWL